MITDERAQKVEDDKKPMPPTEEGAEKRLEGHVVGHFKIIRRIGEGGMGEVYVAEDMTLPRQVAIKILPPHLMTDAERVQRFMQEARLISRLNHPNILTIHEVMLDGKWPYIVTEFVEGITLRQKMNGGPMRLSEALDIVAQVTSALETAHQAEIVHRDVKPENVMIRRDGYVKVLDFGLAKLLAAEIESAETPTRALIKSEVGIVMGTVQYMSPEQARGLPIDARTDVWSLGVVLYEMITGRAPFEGSTSSDVIASILKTEPPPLLHFQPEIPITLQQLVRKALRKDYAERYRTAGEMAVDLKNLRRDVEAGLVSSVGQKLKAPAASASFHERPAATTLIGVTTHTAEGSSLNFNSRSGRFAAWANPQKRVLISVLAALVLSAAGLTYWLYARARQKSSAGIPALSLEKMNVSKITTNGKAVVAAISSDGKYVAYALNELGQQKLQVRQVITSSSIQVVAPEKVRYTGLTFSPDGNYIYYVRLETEHPLGALYRVPVLGGVSQRILSHIDSRVTFSPDGLRLAFVRNDPDAAESALLVASYEGLGAQKIAVRKSPDNFSTPAWSPDGESIVCTARYFSNGYYRKLLEISVASGAVKQLSPHRWESMGAISWLADNSGMIVAARDEASKHTQRQQIWHLSYPAGEARRLTNDLSNYSSVQLTADSTSLVGVQFDEYSNVWTADLTKSGAARQITSNRHDGLGLAWTPDQRIVYRSLASGNPDLWIVNADGTNEQQLTTDPRPDFQPVVTPDGRRIIFTSQRTDGTSIWRMNIDGSDQTQLTNGGIDNEPFCSPDGKWVVYTSWSGERPTLWKVPVDGGTPTKITDYYTSSPVVSPDGQRIACAYRSKERGLEWNIAIIPFEGGQPLKVFDWHSPVVRWSADGQALLYVSTYDSVANIFSQPVAGGKAMQLTDFKSERIFFFDLSRTGQQLALARGAQTGDVILMSNFR